MNPNQVPVSRTKVMVPALRPEVLRRERLLSLLDEILDRKLYLISAPAGYGKTTLLVDLAGSSEMPFCWLSVDTLDQDPQRFISYFIAAIAERFPRFGAHSSGALMGLTSLDAGLENLVITISNEIYEQVSEHFALVIDDYQHVDAIPEIRDFIGRFLQLAGENCHVILSSRRLPALPDMTLLVARDQVGGFTLDELAFQPEEIRQLYAKNYRLQITDDDLEEILRQTEGWITGLHLTKPGQLGDLPDMTRAARATGVDLAAYLDQQVLGQQSPEVRSFLLQTSLFDEFDAKLCAAVLEQIPGGLRANWKKLIETVRSSNLFVLPVGPGGRWLRYHNLFQEFLRKHMQEERPEQARRILDRLAHVHEERSEWEQTRQIYQQMDDQEAVLALLERAGTHLINEDRLITLGEWLDAIPDAVIQERPILLSLSGTLKFFRGDFQPGLDLLDQAIPDLEVSGDTVNLALSFIRRANIHRYLGNYPTSIQDAEEAAEIISVGQDHPEIQAEAFRMKGLGLFRSGQPRLAVEWLERALGINVQLKQGKSISMLQMELGMVYRAIGDYQAAKNWYGKAMEAWKRGGGFTWQSNLLNSLGVLYHVEGEYEKAVQTLEMAMDQARRSGFPRTQALAYASLGDVYAELEDHELAGQAYRHTENYARQTNDRFLLHYAITARAGIARASGDYEKARDLLEEIRASVVRSRSNYEQGLYRLEYGRLEVCSGHAAKAVEHLLASLDSLTRGDLVLEQGLCRLWLAAAYLRQEERAAAGSQVKQLGSLFKDRNYPSSLCLAALQLRDWLVDLKHDTGAYTVLKQLYQTAELTLADFPGLRRRIRHLARSISVLPPQVEIKSLGKSQVHVSGKLVTNAQWKTREVRELFFFFVCNPRPMTKEEIGALLWPDLSSQQLKLRFKNDIYRLRHAIGQNAILFEQNEYRFNRAMDYFFDVDAFEAALFNAGITKDAQEQIRYLQSAVELVRGRFMEDLDATWLLSERERLEQEYLNSLLELSNLYLKTGKPDQALKTCQRALVWDNCYEAAHCLAMRIYAASGDRAAIAAQYHALRRALETELGVHPMRETEDLYRTLTA